MIFILIIFAILFLVFGFLALRKFLAKKYGDKINTLYNQMISYDNSINGDSHDKED